MILPHSASRSRLRLRKVRTVTAELPEHERNRLRSVAATDSDLERLVARRLAGEPLQYLEGTAHFPDFELRVDERVLIPRPETEQLFEQAVLAVASPSVIVDLCTGSGALAIALARRFPDAEVYATDISSRALELAEENARDHHARVWFLEGNLYDPLPAHLLGGVDLLVANPPYLAEGEYERLPRDVRHEPREALVAGRSGLEVIEAIGAEAIVFLSPTGAVVCEIGETQGGDVEPLFVGLEVEVRRDLAGRDRFVVGTRR